MSTYKEIKGFKVQTLSTDTAASQAATGTWASGGALTTGRNGLRGAGVSQTAVVVFGGNDGSTTGKTENYNGSSWSETTDLNTAKSNGLGVGTYTSALCTETGTNEKWNGSSWTELAELSTPRAEIGSFGTSTAALAIGNQNGSSGIVEQWNGSSWTEVGDLTTAMGSVCGFGTTSAGNAAGGYTGTVSATNNQIWDGSSWSEGSDLNQSRYFGGASGTSTLGLVFGGYKTQSPASQIANTESWDGTSFTEQADLSTARYVGAPAHNSTSSDALYAGGNPGNQSATEEWTAPSTFTKINLGQVYYNSGSNAFKVTSQPVAGGTWSAGGNLNTGRNYLPEFSFATQTAGFAVGGNISPKQQTEQYNGSSWTEVADLNSTLYGRSGFGTNASAVVAGGNGPPTSTNSETWDNSSWTEGNNLNTARRDAAGAGITTAGLVIGAPAVVESYNGTSYTEVADLNTGRSELGGGGTSTSALVFGGYPSTAATESWDGTSWTEVSDLNSARSDNGTACISNQGALYFGNGNEYWNGSSWTEVNDLSTSRVGLGGNGTTTSALAFGGYPITASTEEWTVTAAVGTVTTS